MLNHTDNIYSGFKESLLWVVWPGIVFLSLSLYWVLISHLNISFENSLQIHFLGLFFLIFLFEWIIPCHKNWNKYDGQSWNDLLYNITFPIMQIIVTLLALKVVQLSTNNGIMSFIDIKKYISSEYVQFFVLILIVDLLWYICHRTFHTLPRLWNIHALHHNSDQLHVLNNARVHPLEVFALFFPILLVVQFIKIPESVFNWFLVFQLSIGLLTHSNINTRTGWLAYIFNTPEVHRWHHSRIRTEHNNNYGSVTMFWDHIFRTYFNPRDRNKSEDIGINTLYTSVPTKWFDQLVIPFRSQKKVLLNNYSENSLKSNTNETPKEEI